LEQLHPGQAGAAFALTLDIADLIRDADSLAVALDRLLPCATVGVLIAQAA
jgi:hypothetical protein